MGPTGSVLGSTQGVCRGKKKAFSAGSCHVRSSGQTTWQQAVHHRRMGLRLWKGAGRRAHRGTDERGTADWGARATPPGPQLGTLVLFRKFAVGQHYRRTIFWCWMFTTHWTQNDFFFQYMALPVQ